MCTFYILHEHIVTPVRLRVRANLNGRLAERSKAHVWSTCIRATVSRVRIPNLPNAKTPCEIRFRFFYFLEYLKCGKRSYQ